MPVVAATVVAEDWLVSAGVADRLTVGLAHPVWFAGAPVPVAGPVGRFGGPGARGCGVRVVAGLDVGGSCEAAGLQGRGPGVHAGSEP